MEQKYTRFFRHDFPSMRLPFFPRGAGINHFECGDSEELKACPFCEISWVASGECEFHSGGQPQTAFKGMSYIWIPGEPHGKKAVASGTTVIYYATFEGPCAVDILNQFGYHKGLQRSQECPVPLYNRIMHGLASSRITEYRGLVPLYVDLISRMSECENNPPDIVLDPFADKCLYTIQAECGDCDFNIDLLADRLNVHRSTVRRAVERATGKTPVAYLEECRMKRALDLLKNTLLPIKTVAAWSGFRRTNYFCRLIRMKTGCSPAAWRVRSFADSNMN